MFRSHWRLALPPFEAQPDSRFYWPTPRHDQALAALNYAACTGGEAVLLTGPAGCGKTLLLRTLRRRLPREQYHVVFVPEAGGCTMGLLRRVAYQLARELVPDSAAAADLILRHLQATSTASHIVIMLDDWAAEVPPEHVSELRWLLNLELEERALCVLLAGQSLHPTRDWPGWLQQRLLANVAVQPLALADVPSYLAHHLQIAAGSNQDAAPARVFAPAAAQAIAEWSAGVPRLVNRLANLALHVGALEQATEIAAEAVQQAAARLTDWPAVPAGSAECPDCHVPAPGGR